MKEKFNPCPFCGSLNLEIGKRTRSELMYVLCSDCEAQGPTSSMERDAIYFWNDWQDRILQEE